MKRLQFEGKKSCWRQAILSVRLLLNNYKYGAEHNEVIPVVAQSTLGWDLSYL